MRHIRDSKKIAGEYSDYLSDESRIVPSEVENIYFPNSTEDVSGIIKDAYQSNEKIVVSGGRTGIVGGSVACGVKHLISLDNVRGEIEIGYDSEWFLRCGAGYRLEEIYKFLSDKNYVFTNRDLPQVKIPEELFYPVNPTEATAQIGGTVAVNASGARSYLYGQTRKWVRALKVVLPNGQIVGLRRNQIFAKNSELVLSGIRIPIKNIPYPEIKNTLGYPLSENMDAIDLFIGSEGTLGVITEVEIALIDRPKNVMGQIIFFSDKDAVVSMVDNINRHSLINPAAVEYFDANALRLLRDKKNDETMLLLPNIPDFADYALYVELNYNSENELEVLFNELEALLAASGVSMDETWAENDERGLLRMKYFRHAVPEIINRIISQRKKKIPQLTKLSTDMAVSPNLLGQMLNHYELLLDEAAIEYVIFGHIGDAHVHVNFLPNTMDDLNRAHELIFDFARAVILSGGSIAAEHGVGRLKKKFLQMQYGEKNLQKMRDVKKALDPNFILNPGVLFD